MATNHVFIEKSEGIGILTISLLPANPLSRKVTEDLNVALDELLGDKDIKCIVITGEGNKIFASGADIRELEALDETSAIELLSRVKEVLGKILACPKPVIAAINGHALGGGLELALHCDFRVAVESAKFGFPEIKLAVMPGAGATQLLPRLVGAAQAKWLLLTGETVTAKHALEIDLVDRVVKSDLLMDSTAEIGKTLSTKPPLAYHSIKKALEAGREMPFAQALQEETMLFGKLCATQDKAEGVRAFLEKRAPKFIGR